MSVLCEEPQRSLAALPLLVCWPAALGDQSGRLQMAWPVCSHRGCGSYPEWLGPKEPGLVILHPGGLAYGA